MHIFLRRLARQLPEAVAHIHGSAEYPRLQGVVKLYDSGSGGSLVTVEVQGLPKNKPFLGVHIHNGESCTGNADDAFADAGMHLNLELLEHPFHTGDFPPLLNNSGYCWTAFYTERFTPDEVLGFPVIIHSDRDDLISQPAGNSGAKIGCGIIRPVKRL